MFRHQPHSNARNRWLALVGGTVAIAALLYATDFTHMPMMVASFAATCVLLFAAPTAIVSQPINVIGGHMVSCAIGLLCAWAWPDSHIAAGLAVGLSITAMMALRVVNPPAGATALVAYTAGGGWWFFVFPVSVGSVALVLFAVAYHRATGGTYPLQTH